MWSDAQGYVKIGPWESDLIWHLANKMNLIQLTQLSPSDSYKAQMGINALMK